MRASTQSHTAADTHLLLMLMLRTTMLSRCRVFTALCHVVAAVCGFCWVAVCPRRHRLTLLLLMPILLFLFFRFFSFFHPCLHFYLLFRFYLLIYLFRFFALVSANCRNETQTQSELLRFNKRFCHAHGYGIPVYTIPYIYIYIRVVLFEIFEMRSYSTGQAHEF